MSTYLKYPYNWSRNIVNSFVEKYARGAYNFARMLDISPGEFRSDLTMILSTGNSLRWDIMKRTIKALSSDFYADIKVLSPGDRKVLLKCLVYLSTDDALDRKKSGEVLDQLRQRILF